MIAVVIIGSGSSGLACARTLAAAGLVPVVLDKGRGIGGRVATRRVGPMPFDNGAVCHCAKALARCRGPWRLSLTPRLSYHFRWRIRCYWLVPTAGLVRPPNQLGGQNIALR